MKCEYMKKQFRHTAVESGTPVIVGSMVIRLVFADKENLEVPEIVGNILKGVYLQRQCV